MRVCDDVHQYSIDDVIGRGSNRIDGGESNVNGYDVMGFWLQLAQMIPVISVCLESVVPNRWLARSLTLLAVMAIWGATVYIGTRRKRGNKSGSACALRRIKSG